MSRKGFRRIGKYDDISTEKENFSYVKEKERIYDYKGKKDCIISFEEKEILMDER